MRIIMMKEVIAAEYLGLVECDGVGCHHLRLLEKKAGYEV